MLKKQREGSKSPLFYCLHIVSKSKSWLFQKKCRACKFARGEISPSENYQISPPTPEAAALAARRRAFQATRPRLNASQLHNLGHLVHTPPTADGQRLGLYTKKAQPHGHASTPHSSTPQRSGAQPNHSRWPTPRALHTTKAQPHGHAPTTPAARLRLFLTHSHSVGPHVKVVAHHLERHNLDNLQALNDRAAICGQLE